MQSAKGSDLLVKTHNSMIQFIGKQGHTFCFIIGNKRYDLVKCSLYLENHCVPLPAKAKGSTPGWYIGRKFVSYNQLKKAILQVAV